MITNIASNIYSYASVFFATKSVLVIAVLIVSENNDVFLVYYLENNKGRYMEIR